MIYFYFILFLFSTLYFLFSTFIFILFYLFIYLFIFSRTHGKQHRVREGVRIRNA